MKKKINDKDMDKLLFEYLVRKTIEETFNENSKKEVCLTFNKKKNGDIEVNLKGKAIELLIALASLEKELLTKYDVSEETFNIIRDGFGIKEKKIIEKDRK